ncbi:hypothetical protein ZIOFF_013364 [Zingiber officinale]|uniref:Elongin-C n=1 Tax=Zingiber officinale TaxID=94328 RepID=A0A8J5HRT7_ZINOF|nr:hypothetical protein ZIOFF_013364 [Zingiber officinale]
MPLVLFGSQHRWRSRAMEGEEKTRNGGEMVKLISAEGFEFVIDKKAAMVSQTISNMLTSPGGFAETQLGVVTFPEISTPILEKICQYFYWNLDFQRFFSLTFTLISCSIA